MTLTFCNRSLVPGDVRAYDVGMDGEHDATTRKGADAAFVEKATKPGKYGDGAGLYLRVRSKDAKFWSFIFTRQSKRPEMGLGPAVGRAAVSLSEAR